MSVKTAEPECQNGCAQFYHFWVLETKMLRRPAFIRPHTTSPQAYSPPTAVAFEEVPLERCELWPSRFGVPICRASVPGFRDPGGAQGRSVDHSVARSVGHSVDNSIDHPVDRSVAHSVDRSVGRPLGRSHGWPIRRSIARSITRSIARPIIQEP